MCESLHFQQVPTWCECCWPTPWEAKLLGHTLSPLAWTNCLPWSGPVMPSFQYKLMPRSHSTCFVSSSVESVDFSLLRRLCFWPLLTSLLHHCPCSDWQRLSMLRTDEFSEGMYKEKSKGSKYSNPSERKRKEKRGESLDREKGCWNQWEHFKKYRSPEQSLRSHYAPPLFSRILPSYFLRGTFWTSLHTVFLSLWNCSLLPVGFEMAYRFKCMIEKTNIFNEPKFKKKKGEICMSWSEPRNKLWLL